MIVMLSLMRMLEAAACSTGRWPASRRCCALRAGVFTAAADQLRQLCRPVATLAMMDQRGASSQHLAATLAMVIPWPRPTMSMPLAARWGCTSGIVLAWSMVGGLVAAAATYYAPAAKLSATETLPSTKPLQHPVADSPRAFLTSSTGPVPKAFRSPSARSRMLVLSLTVVLALRRLGRWMRSPGCRRRSWRWAPVRPGSRPPSPVFAGGTAMMGVMDEMLQAGTPARPPSTAPAPGRRSTAGHPRRGRVDLRRPSR